MCFAKLQRTKTKTALSLVEAAPGGVVAQEEGEGVSSQTAASAGGARGALGAKELSYYCGPHDLKRLELYSRNLVRRDNFFFCVRSFLFFVVLCGFVWFCSWWWRRWW